MTKQPPKPEDTPSPPETDGTPDNLLGELESLKDLLEDTGPAGETFKDNAHAAIPMLNDVISKETGDHLEPSGTLLNLESIFDDATVASDAGPIEAHPDRGDDFTELALPGEITDSRDAPTDSSDVVPPPRRAADRQPANLPGDDLDFLIQEIVDELIPIAEDRLRQRLSGYPREVILQLADRLLKSD